MDYFRQIRDADAEYASKCISHWKTFIVGPPNHPNEDEYGLLKVIESYRSSGFFSFTSLCLSWFVFSLLIL